MQFVAETKNKIEYYTVPALYEAGFYNIFTTKYHGNSFSGKELNFGTNCQDTPEAILDNYNAVLSLLNLDASKAVKSKQTHSDITLTVDSSYGGEGILKEQRFREADGLITTEDNLAILIFYADCVPVLIADKKQKIISAVHSGWKGTKKNIVGKTIQKLIEENGSKPEDLLCAIGPSIGLCHFEVDEALYQEMTALFGLDTGKTENGKFYLDLKKTVCHQLRECQIPEENIAISNLCTVCEETMYSYRREGEKAGRMAAFIARR